MDTPPPQLRLLAPRKGLTAGAGVAPGDALDNVLSAFLVDGALCLVRGQGLYQFVLGDTTAASSPIVVAPADGGGRWHFLKSENQSYLDVRDFGTAVATGGDDTTAVQAAVNSLANSDPTKLGGGTIFIPSGCSIASTLFVTRQSLVLFGSGWGRAPGLSWAGAAGIPLLQIQDCYGMVIHDLWVEGDASNLPSALVRCYRVATDTVGTNGQFQFTNLLLGPQKFDDPVADTFSAALLVDGTNGNNDEFHLSRVVMNRGVRGIDAPNSQSIWNHMQNVLVASMTETGIRTAANMQFTNLTCNRNAVDITTIATARVDIFGWQSENTEKAAHLGASSILSVIGGTVRCNEVTGNLIDGDPCVRYTSNSTPHIQGIMLRNMIFPDATASMKIALAPAEGQDIGELTPKVELYNVRGLVLPGQLDIDPVDGFDRRRLVVDIDDVKFDRTLQWPKTATQAFADYDPYSTLDTTEEPAAAIADTDTDTTNLQNTVNAVLAVLRRDERIEWPEDPNSALLGNNEGWWSAATQAVLAGTSVPSITDYSGNARNADQGVGASQPTARGAGAASYFEYDGIDDSSACVGAASDWRFLHGSQWAFGGIFRIPVIAATILWSTWNGSTSEGTSFEVSGASNNQFRVRTRTGGVTTALLSPVAAIAANTWYAFLVQRHNDAITALLLPQGGAWSVVIGQPVPAAGAPADPGGTLRTARLVSGSSTRMDYAMAAAWSQSFAPHWTNAIKYDLAAVLAGL